MGTRLQDCRQHAGPAGVAAHADDYLRLELAQQAQAFHYAERQIEHGAQAGCEADIFQLTRADEVEFESGFGHQPRLQPALRADETDLGAMRVAQFASDCECRNDVAAGSAAGYEDSQLAAELLAC